MSIEGGMQLLTDELQKDFEAHGHDACVELKYRVERITITDTDGAAVRLSLRTKDGKREEITAKRVVLALSQAALLRIEFRDERTSVGEFRLRTIDDFRAVRSYRLAKIFVWFKEAWWHGENSGSFKVFSDRSLRQLYFYSGTHDARSGGESPIQGVMLAYTDEDFARYWTAQSVAYGNDRKWMMAELLNLDGTLESVRSEFGVARRFWECVAAQLADLFPGVSEDTIRDSGMFAAYRDWGNHPWGGGWHAWDIGVKPWKVRQNIMQPFRNVPVYVCGEAFSCEQGWIEGALRSAERVLIDGFNLNPTSLPNMDSRLAELRYDPPLDPIRAYVRY